MRVAVILPCGMPDPRRLKAGLDWLRALGLDVVPPVARRRWGPAQLAGDDETRARELADALVDPANDIVWCGRGGTGMHRTLLALDRHGFDLGVRPELPVVGLSDVTPLLVRRYQRGGRSVHGPVVTMLPSLDAPSSAATRRWLRAPAQRPALPPQLQARGGSATTGPVIVGNLAMLAASCGTPAQPMLRGALLVLEDVSEPAWRVDRFAAQLAYAGALDGVAALVGGTFEGCTPPGGAERVLRGWAAARGVPWRGGAPIGHGAACWPVEYGSAGRVRAGRSPRTAS